MIFSPLLKLTKLSVLMSYSKIFFKWKAEDFLQCCKEFWASEPKAGMLMIKHCRQNTVDSSIELTTFLCAFSLIILFFLSAFSSPFQSSLLFSCPDFFFPESSAQMPEFYFLQKTRPNILLHWVSMSSVTGGFLRSGFNSLCRLSG